ncbi:MAG: hypothetical protein L7R83_00185 [Candidatus Poseidonia sp.]|nr:hypothetical protein [Poseidonia sp.]
MNQHNIDFIGGGFKLTFPYTFVGWVVWVLGLIITGYGVVAAMTDPFSLGLSVIGLTMMAFISPGSMSAGLHRLRKESISPADLQAKADESGYTMENWFLQQSTLVPTNDPNDWILPAPGPQTWNHDNMYGPHGDGSPLPEHPAKIGTPQPATMTLHLVFAGAAAILLLVVGGLGMQDEEIGALPALIIAGMGLVLTLVNFYRAKALRQMIDTPTSLVRSAAVGYPELVGQVRPWAAGTMVVHVDSNQSMSMPNMIGYHWTYEQKQCRKVEDSEGNTKEECSWVTVRSDSGGVPFILQDGTGGIKVNLESFKRTDYGQFLKRWEGAFAQSLGKQLMSSAVAGLLRGVTVKGHRWTLYGLRSGDPVYILGATKPRDASELQADPQADGTLGNSTIEVWGNEDAPGTKCTLLRGSELSNIGKSRSGFEMMVPPILLLLGGLSLLGLA